ncbi:hypothetical protein BGP77_02815 [Saccharospirillum sp. MSK14-1]|uniref:DUF2868 domain-containing protein n=1 Tax=Saccharospirillum sp. MSK14-1 TaxID=1897632 RepID=UPI000D3C2328|nr:DUF2868 domain-containing protein [Saccharospirillum sp. MSK14-1]PTY36259.1 hypothetical protein BGP77_02815 [Saccharospirillum sp. MSK14-1]
MRWLDADPDYPAGPASDWLTFLRQANVLPAQVRLRLVRYWPLLAAINGVLSMVGLNVWPASGIHLLGFLLLFWLLPVLFWSWQATALLSANRAPWWRPLFTSHRDKVIGLWCSRQAVLAQLSFTLAALATLWAMLFGREVVFYWSTSLPAVSGLMDESLAMLTLGWLDAPDPLIISASQAGAVSGWQQTLLNYSFYWAAWLSQVVALWVLLPLALLLPVFQLRLMTVLKRWPQYNHQLRARFQLSSPSAVHYQALDAAEPVANLAVTPLDEQESEPLEPGFIWQLGRDFKPSQGSLRLGAISQREDEQAVAKQSRTLSVWYCSARSVPTGDLADLLLKHRATGGHPRVYLLARRGDTLEPLNLARNWRAFMERHRLSDVPVILCWTEALNE